MKEPDYALSGIAGILGDAETQLQELRVKVRKLEALNAELLVWFESRKRALQIACFTLPPSIEAIAKTESGK